MSANIAAQSLNDVGAGITDFFTSVVNNPSKPSQPSGSSKRASLTDIKDITSNFSTSVSAAVTLIAL